MVVKVMAEKTSEFNFYEDYVVVEGTCLSQEMAHLLSKMNEQRCNVRHFKQWEAEMNGIKEDYHLFKRNIVKQINECLNDDDLESKVCTCCEKMEDQYEALTLLYLAKRGEIQDNTTYFESQVTSPKLDVRFVLKQMLDKLDVHVVRVHLKRK